MIPRVTIQHPRKPRRRRVTRNQIDRYLTGGWRIVDPPDVDDVDIAFTLVATGAEHVLIPPEGTVKEIVAWVGDDPARARAALVAEPAPPRKSLITQLETIATTSPDDGEKETTQ